MITTCRENGTLVIQTEDRLYGAKAQAFHDRLEAAIESVEGSVVINLQGLAHVGNAVLRVIVQAIREMQQQNLRLAICASSDDVRAAFRSSGLDRLGPVHTNQSEMLSSPYGNYRSSVRTHCAGSPSAAGQRQTCQLAGAERYPLRRRARLQVAGVAAPLRQLAYRLHPDEPLVEERRAGPGV